MATVPQRWQNARMLNTIARILDPPWRRARSAERRAWAWAALAGAVSCYLLAFLYVGPRAGAAVTALYALPCVMAGWAFGASGGLLVALLTIPLHAALYSAGILPPDNDGALTVALGLASSVIVGVSVGAARDLREKVRERSVELAASEDRYRQLVDNSPEGVMVHERGVVVFANPSMAKLVGAESASALVGRTVVTLAPFEDRDALSSSLVFARARDPTTVRTRLAPPNGPNRDVIMTSMPIDYRGASARLVLVREHAIANVAIT